MGVIFPCRMCCLCTCDISMIFLELGLYLFLLEFTATHAEIHAATLLCFTWSRELLPLPPHHTHTSRFRRKPAIFHWHLRRSRAFSQCCDTQRFTSLFSPFGQLALIAIRNRILHNHNLRRYILCAQKVLFLNDCVTMPHIHAKIHFERISVRILCVNHQ